MHKDEIMTLDEAAVAIGVSSSTMRNWRFAQTHGQPFQGVRIRQAGNRNLYCLRSDVEAYAKNYRPSVGEWGGDCA